MQLFQIFGSILLKDNDVKKELTGIDAAAKGTGNNFDSVFGKIKSAALKLGAVLGVSLGFKEMIEGAANAQKNMVQMDNVLKSTKDASGMTKDALLKLADAQGKITTFSKGANMETENLLLTFTNIGKKTFPDALKAVNDMSQALGQDTKSSAIQLGKALNDPVKGITALSRVGVSFTQQQKSQIEAMEKAGNIAGAQAIILKELQKEFGGSAEAAGKTFGGQLTILKNNISGVAANLGSYLLPYLQNFVSAINNGMPVIKQTISDVIKTVSPYIKDIIKDVVKIVENLLPSFGKSTGDTKGKVLDLVKNGLADLKAIFDWLATHGELVKGALIGIGGAFLTFKAVDTTVKTINNVKKGLDDIKTAAGNVKKGFDIAKDGASKFSGILSKVGSGAAEGAKAVGKLVVKLAESAAGFVKSTAKAGAHIISLGLHKAASLASAAAEGILSAAQAALNFVMSLNPITLIIIAITALIAIGVVLYNKSTTFRNFVNTCWNGLKSFGSWIKSGFIAIVNYIGNGLASFRNTVSSIVNAIGNFFTNLRNGIVNKASSIGTAIINGIKSAVNFITGLPGKALNWGKDFIQGFINGIKNMIGKVGDAVKGVADKVKNFLHFSKPDEGPLADYETWMPDFMQGMAKGIDKNKYKVTDAVKNLTKDMSVTAKLNTSAIGTNKNNTLAVEGNNGKLTVNFNGNYCFMNKEMIDYFTSKVSNAITLQAARRD